MRRVDATQRLRVVHGTRSPDELVRSLDDPSPEVVRAAIARLVDLEGQQAAGPLRARFFDVDLSPVADVAGALRRIGDGGAVEVAMKALRDGRYSRRLAGVRALGALGDPRSRNGRRLSPKSGLPARCCDHRTTDRDDMGPGEEPARENDV